MLIHRPPFSHAWTPGKLVLVSGLSDPRTCALSPVQSAFLRVLPAPEAWKVYWNFPFLPCPNQTYRPVPILAASWQNYRQFQSAVSPSFRKAARWHWRALTESTHRLFVFTLSCGFEILRNLAAFSAPNCRIEILAFGPVAWGRPRIPHTLVQGAKDLFSRPFFPEPDLRIPNLAHLDYLDNPSVLQFAHDYLDQRLNEIF